MKKEYIEIGKIANTHGIKGELKIIPLTDNPARFEDLEWVYIDFRHNLEKFFIQNIRYHKNHIIIKFKQYDSINDVEKFKNCMVKIDRDLAVKLPEDTYFITDLLGLRVETHNGEYLGDIVDVISTGSNDVYIVKGQSNKEILIPAIKEVVLEVNLEENFIVIKLLEGLIDE